MVIFQFAMLNYQRVPQTIGFPIDDRQFWMIFGYPYFRKPPIWLARSFHTFPWCGSRIKMSLCFTGNKEWELFSLGGTGRIKQLLLTNCFLIWGWYSHQLQPAEWFGDKACVSTDMQKQWYGSRSKIHRIVGVESMKFGLVQNLWDQLKEGCRSSFEYLWCSGCLGFDP